MNSLKGIANFIGTQNLSKAQTLFLLKSFLPSTNFETIYYVDTLGQGINTRDQTINIKDRDYFLQALEGTTFIGTPLHSKIRDAIIIPFAAPICNNDGQVIGVLSEIGRAHV